MACDKSYKDKGMKDLSKKGTKKSPKKPVKKGK